MGANQSHGFWDAMEGLRPNPPEQNHIAADDYRDDFPEDVYPYGDQPAVDERPDPYPDWDLPVEKGFVGVLLFPVDEDNPRIIQMPFDVLKNGADIGDSTVYWTYEKRTGLSAYIPSDLQFTYVKKAGKDGPPLERNLEVLYAWDEKSSLDGTPLNRCIRHITGGKAPVRWNGHVIVSRTVQTHTEMNDMAEKFEDATMEDVKPMLSFFLHCSGEKRREVVLNRRAGEMFRYSGPGIKYWESEFQ